MDEDREETRTALRCDLGALDEGQRARRAELERELRSAVIEVRTTADGYAVRLQADSEAARRLEELVALENRCCPFLGLEIRRSDQEAGPTLHIRDGEGIREFLRSQLGFETVPRRRS